jgi:hypothetical protein
LREAAAAAAEAEAEAEDRAVKAKNKALSGGGAEGDMSGEGGDQILHVTAINEEL